MMKFILIGIVAAMSLPDCSAHFCASDPTHFICPSGYRIPARWVCDGDNDCGGRSDELDCPRCANGEKLCTNYCGGPDYCVLETSECMKPDGNNTDQPIYPQTSSYPFYHTTPYPTAYNERVAYNDQIQVEPEDSIQRDLQGKSEKLNKNEDDSQIIFGRQPDKDIFE